MRTNGKRCLAVLSCQQRKSGRGRQGQQRAGQGRLSALLVTQLRNQNPLEPLSNTEYIAQMAQFTSVEQLMNLAGEMTALRNNLGIASSLIGMSVEWSSTISDRPAGDAARHRRLYRRPRRRTSGQIGNREISLNAITSMSLPGGGGTDGLTASGSGSCIRRDSRSASANRRRPARSMPERMKAYLFQTLLKAGELKFSRHAEMRMQQKGHQPETRTAEQDRLGGRSGRSERREGFPHSVSGHCNDRQRAV